MGISILEIMFGIDLSEFIILLIIIIIVIEPQKWPVFLYHVAKTIARIKGFFFVIQTHIDTIFSKIDNLEKEEACQNHQDSQDSKS